MFEQYKPRLKRIYHALRAVFEVRRRIRGRGNSCELRHCVLRNVILDIEGDSNSVKIDEGCVVEGLVVKMRGNNHTLHIGERSYIKDSQLFFEDSRCRISIGEASWLTGARLSAVENNQSIHLGKLATLAEGTDLRTSDSHSILDAASCKRLNPPGSIHLGEHVWIGKNVTILKGVTIGNHSIVGLGSVVTRDIPDNCVAAGVPAKVLRTGVTWDWDKLPC
ncbi:acyltransferase [Fundidesulfovibrio agrisoli]|uniref:acyltransferase n=1 Tax=Fundidesulfovibrio agrisoli TaxID=2922717 RepID=UPI0024348113|nr:acyltransferase [Fundidesulfovibrio agrisoli]